MVFDSYDVSQWSAALKSSRTEYQKLRDAFVINSYIPAEWLVEEPENTLIYDTVSSTASDPLSRNDNHSKANTSKTPSQSSSSKPVNSHPNISASDTDLIDLLLADIPRTFPDIPFFQNRTVKVSLFRILYIYAKQNPDIGYRQGMHELAAPMIQVVWQDLDKLSPREGGATGKKHTDIKKSAIGEQEPEVVISFDVESDAYLLFCALMKSAKPWYASQVNDDSSHLPPPIVSKSHYIQYVLLKKADPVLYDKISYSLKLSRAEPQIWALRWIRLLFAREVSFKNFLWLWDAIFAATDPNTSYQAVEDYNLDYEKLAESETSTLADMEPLKPVETPEAVLKTFQVKRCVPLELLVDYICIVLLLRIRSLLLVPSFPGSSFVSSPQLTVSDMNSSDISPHDLAAHIIATLLNYPTTTISTDDRSMSLIVANAIKLIEHDASPECAGYVARKYSRLPGSLHLQSNAAQTGIYGTNSQSLTTAQLTTASLTAGFNNLIDKARLSVARSVKQAKNGSSPWDEAVQNAKTAFLSVKEQVREQAEQMSDQVKEQIRERENESNNSSSPPFLSKRTSTKSKRSSVSGGTSRKESDCVATILDNALRVLEEPEFVNIYKNGASISSDEKQAAETATSREINYKTAVAYVRFARDLLVHSADFDQERLKGYLAPIGISETHKQGLENRKQSMDLSSDKVLGAATKGDKNNDKEAATEKEKESIKNGIVPLDVDSKPSSPAPVLIRSRKGRRIANSALIEDPDHSKSTAPANSGSNKTTALNSTTTSKIDNKALKTGNKSGSADSKSSRTTLAQSEFSWMLESEDGKNSAKEAGQI